MDKIYTKTGDKGTTSNFLGKVYFKSDPEIELVGGVDEINANIGYLRSYLEDSQEVNNKLKTIQYHLYLIGAEISTEFTETHITSEEVQFLEDSIDEFTDRTGPMKSFIHYSGVKEAAFCHVVKAITRRVERDFVSYLKGKDFPECYSYINRLSDFFFALARYLNALKNVEDEPLYIK